MSVEFVLRLVGMVLFSIVGVFVGAAFASLADAPRDSYAVIFGLIGALTGLILTPYLTTRPARYIRGKLARAIPFREAISALHDVVVSDLRFQPKDRSEYQAWLAQQEDSLSVVNPRLPGPALDEGLEEECRRAGCLPGWIR